MRLSNNDKQVLYGAQFDAKTSVPQLAKRLKLKEHTIHYSLNRLKDAEVIRPTVFLDSFKLGIREYVVYFSIASRDVSPRTNLVRFLERSPRLVWFAHLGGNYQYAMTVLAKTSSDVINFMEALSAKHGELLYDKSIATLVSFTLFKKAYLVEKPEKQVIIDKRETADIVEVSEEDKKIIAGLFHYRTHQELAKAIGIPRTTIEYRLKKLVEDGIIRSYVYNISARRLGMQTYKVLLASKGISKSFREQVAKLSLEHPNIVNLLQCIGSWDFELTVEVAESEEMVKISQDLFSCLGSQLSKSEILPVFRQLQPSSYLSN